MTQITPSLLLRTDANETNLSPTKGHLQLREALLFTRYFVDTVINNEGNSVAYPKEGIEPYEEFTHDLSKKTQIHIAFILEMVLQKKDGNALKFQHINKAITDNKNTLVQWRTALKERKLLNTEGHAAAAIMTLPDEIKLADIFSTMERHFQGKGKDANKKGVLTTDTQVITSMQEVTIQELIHCLPERVEAPNTRPSGRSFMRLVR